MFSKTKRMKKSTFLIISNIAFLFLLVAFDRLNNHLANVSDHVPIIWCLAAFLVTEISWFQIGQNPNRFRLRLIPAAAVLAMIYLQIVTSTGNFSLLGLSDKLLQPALEMAESAFAAGFLYVTAKDECKEAPAPVAA